MRQLKITNRITSRESLALDKYLNEISKIDMLTGTDEADLAHLIRQGDQKALNRLVKANLRFVVSVAKQYQNNGLSLSDLINEGNVGLMKAAKRFDETRGFKFISYAVWWIRQSILQAIVEYSRIVRTPASKTSSYAKLKEARHSFMQKFEREPSEQELAEALNVDEKTVVRLINGARNHQSFDAPISNEEGDASLLEFFWDKDSDLQPDDALMEQSVLNEIEHGLSALAPREVEVLKHYFGLAGIKPLSLQEIGDLYDLTRERVRQIKERALRRLRRKMLKDSRKNFYS